MGRDAISLVLVRGDSQGTHMTILIFEDISLWDLVTILLIYYVQALNLSLFWVAAGILGWKYPKSTLEAYNSKDVSTSSKYTMWSWIRSLVVEVAFSAGVNGTVLYYVFPSLIFVFLYSFLPHKVSSRSTLLLCHFEEIFKLHEHFN